VVERDGDFLLYYGGGDKVVGVARAPVKEVVEFARRG
jgi:predicted GH43/DUF377 family glycosyl hydrolase